MNRPSDPQIVLQVVRGERPPGDLALAGIAVTSLRTEAGLAHRVDNPRGVDASAGPADVAAGLLHYGDHPEGRQAWAIALLSGDFLDLGLPEGDPRSDAVLGGLWDAGF